MSENKPSYIKEKNHTDLDVLISMLRRIKYYGKMEIIFEDGKPVRAWVNQSVMFGKDDIEKKQFIIASKDK